ncbi:MAG: hypothetical protein J7J25_04645 [Candidatus Omnitrophica bacterium]|nr:hypothetical protein [Candidatus Omnitrophota bacterium]
MADGGFLVRFLDKDGKAEEYRCYEVTFSFDAWTYKLNNEEPKHFPPLTKIEVIPEEGE